nr:MAG TPA: hypothetical protein [Caudoviricetes sp.]
MKKKQCLNSFVKALHICDKFRTFARSLIIKD